MALNPLQGEFGVSWCQHCRSSGGPVTVDLENPCEQRTCLVLLSLSLADGLWYTLHSGEC